MDPPFVLQFQAVRRFRSILAILLLVVGHVHACASNWEAPDGGRCYTCVEGPCLGDALPQDKLAGYSDDCHACCTLAACEEQSDEESAQVKGQTICLPAPADSLALSEARVHGHFRWPQPILTDVSSGAASSRAPPYR
jgi:hypothetical protein